MPVRGPGTRVSPVRGPHSFTKGVRVSGHHVIVSAIALITLAMPVDAGAQSSQPRPRVGVAFGGGSARGLAHVGVVRWLEEHHIPIDVIAGTSMGGLIGGAFASGMSADELSQLLDQTDWDEMFGFSSFPVQERAPQGGRT